jgi:site-specific DNA-methyltransferase (adenine-specific)
MVTDPPAGISYMGKAWDSYASLQHFQDDMVGIFQETLRILKPGAHGLVWAFPRTSHHTAIALERAGFQLRDAVLHLYGSGMAKAMPSIAKGEWTGWNTALKPAYETWWLVRKPLAEKTIAAQAAATGTGLLNIDACRIASADGNAAAKRRDTARRSGTLPFPVLTVAEAQAKGRMCRRGSPETYLAERAGEELGRWPANLTLSHTAECSEERCNDDCAVLVLENQAQGVSRFFYTSKLGRPERVLPDGSENQHPTAKSIKLMRYLVRLVTPPGGLVLDPFAGSGTTGVAAVKEGFSFFGTELDPEHHRVAALRVAQALDEQELASNLV